MLDPIHECAKSRPTAPAASPASVRGRDHVIRARAVTPVLRILVGICALAAIAAWNPAAGATFMSPADDGAIRSPDTATKREWIQEDALAVQSLEGIRIERIGNVAEDPSCSLGAPGPPVTAIPYIIPPDDAYFTLLSPSQCSACEGSEALSLHSAHVVLLFRRACSIPIQYAREPAAGGFPGLLSRLTCCVGVRAVRTSGCGAHPDFVLDAADFAAHPAVRLPGARKARGNREEG